MRPEEIAQTVVTLVWWSGVGVIDEVSIRRPDADN
jgi:hypothetical protein